MLYLVSDTHNCSLDGAEDIHGNGRHLRKIQIVTAAREAYLEDVGLAYKNSLYSLWTAAFPSGIPLLQPKQWWEMHSEPQHGAGEYCCFPRRRLVSSSSEVFRADSKAWPESSEAINSSSMENDLWEDILGPSVSPHGDAWEVVHFKRVCLWISYCFQTSLTCFSSAQARLLLMMVVSPILSWETVLVVVLYWYKTY